MSVSLNGQNGTSSVVVHRLCGAGAFALPGQVCGRCPQVCVVPLMICYQQQPVFRCLRCPLWSLCSIADMFLHFLCVLFRGCSAQNAECVALFPLPLAAPGFYPASLTEYVSCVPPGACPGVNSTAVAVAFSVPLATGLLRCG
jgi:hypothetical protein